MAQLFVPAFSGPRFSDPPFTAHDASSTAVHLY